MNCPICYSDTMYMYLRVVLGSLSHSIACHKHELTCFFSDVFAASAKKIYFLVLVDFNVPSVHVHVMYEFLLHSMHIIWRVIIVI